MVYMSDGVQAGCARGRKDGRKNVDSGSTGDTVKPVMSPLKKGKKLTKLNICNLTKSSFPYL